MEMGVFGTDVRFVLSWLQPSACFGVLVVLTLVFFLLG
jgi:hypothetical protein